MYDDDHGHQHTLIEYIWILWGCFIHISSAVGSIKLLGNGLFVDLLLVVLENTYNSCLPHYFGTSLYLKNKINEKKINRAAKHAKKVPN